MKQAPLAHMAEELRSKGRGEDTMLVHMTPSEVGGLQQLALASGGSLTINPETGLPEAGWLGRLLPTILGVAGAAFGLPTWAIGLGGLAGGTAATGDLGKGVMAGLGAMGGAGLANAAGLGSSIMGGASNAANAATAAGAPAVNPAMSAAANPAAAAGAIPPMPAGATNVAQAMSNFPGVNPVAAASQGALATPTIPLPASVPIPEVANQSFLQRYAADTSLGLGGFPGKALPMATGYAALAPLLTPDYDKVDMDEDEEYDVPRYSQQRLDPRMDPRYPGGEINFFRQPQRLAEGGETQGLGQYVSMFNTSPGPITASLSYPGGGPAAQARAQIAAQQPNVDPTTTTPPSSRGEVMYGFPTSAPPTPPVGSNLGDRSFGDIMDAIRNGGMGAFALAPALMAANKGGMGASMPNSFAAGGEIHMESGGFVMPARETAEFGNGSTEAGQEFLASLGGMPIRGGGDGVSDSIPALIDGQHPAAVANGETYFPPAAVKRLGGAERLRKMMDAATRSRQEADRGDRHVIRGLA